MIDLFKILILSVILLFSACRPFSKSPQESNNKIFELVIGSRGHSSGKFNRPRGICWDEENQLIYVIDWDGRIQKFTLDGKFKGGWIMPKVKKGKPEELCLDNDGNILVTDTHYSRIVKFNPKGEVIQTFGSYGNGDGQFIYPVGIVVDKEGNIYVSEYGDNNRIQKFDQSGKFLKSIGTKGSDFGQFERPSGMAIGPDGLLYVTDGVNHRVQVLTLDGEFKKIIGSHGNELGQFNYPYDIAFINETMYVLEFGGCRIQKLDMNGNGIKSIGERGNGDGQFTSPWRFCVTNDKLYISDTDNCRVVKLDF